MRQTALRLRRARHRGSAIHAPEGCILWTVNQVHVLQDEEYEAWGISRLVRLAAVMLD